MPMIWERCGKSGMKPETSDECILVFNFGLTGPVLSSLHEMVWLWVPLIPVSQNQGLPTFIEGSHRWIDEASNSYNPVLRPGSALMFDGRLRTTAPSTGGGVVFARAYDIEKL